MRLFFAIDLPEELQEPFAVLQDDLAGAEGLSFTDPEQAHLTMKFLGEVPTEEETDDANGDEPTVSDAKVAGAVAAEATDLGPFEMEVGGLGAFPSEEYISVVWAGVRDGAADLHELAAALETATTERGFSPADNDFTPHVTVARMNDARGKDLVQDRIRNEDPTIGRFTAEELRLTRSVLGEEGAEHETIARFPL
ncbi:RNA 2',3'-cyclic phosphodiesterase [Halolamina salifodinae]|uniref:RNA 2',3'-cyclic phosphodiesterase n=1 Tax=Halolamina salifodinae TaxID=1202767 RepID=A0A8T4GUY3_9EURY|nr:RNA 2',3'-cyclic phosphodiesterase [Halolamina salifodinae]MBP1985883.1 2'-5' RNA ligase [Halolamina salifodinae]